MACTCNIAALPEEAAYGLHNGAHALTCGQHRLSLDPVDAANDAELRDLFGRRPPLEGETAWEYSNRLAAIVRTCGAYQGLERTSEQRCSICDPDSVTDFDGVVNADIVCGDCRSVEAAREAYDRETWALG